MTSAISPTEVKEILQILLSKDLFEAIEGINGISFQEIQRRKIEKGIDLQTILKELSFLLLEINLPQKTKIFVMKRMAELEFDPFSLPRYRVSLSCSEKLQTASLVSAFVEGRTFK